MSAEALKVSVAMQLDPLLGFDSDEAFTGDLTTYAEDLVRYFAHNVERFAGPRSGDVFIALTVQRGDESAAHEYRSGHYVKSDSGAVS